MANEERPCPEEAPQLVLTALCPETAVEVAVLTTPCPVVVDLRAPEVAGGSTCPEGAEEQAERC